MLWLLPERQHIRDDPATFSTKQHVQSSAKHLCGLVTPVRCAEFMCMAAQALTLGGSTEYVVMNWKPEAGTRLTIVPLDGDRARIKTFEMPSWFTFHYVNAFESGALGSIPQFLPPSF